MTDSNLILVIDDHIDTRKLLKELLEESGYLVVEAADGDQGIEICRKEPVDLVITDILMPNKSGVEIIQEIRQGFPEIQIIAITAGVHDFPSVTRIVGVDHTFSKPFKAARMLEVVQSILQSKKGQDSFSI